MEILNRYGRVGEIFYALLEVAPSEETRETLTRFALGVFEDQVEEEATSIEAEVVKAILASKDKATGDSRLAIETVVEEVNFGRGEKEKISSRSIGWITNRLGFKKGRMPDAKGSRAIVLDNPLLEHLRTAYDVKPVDSGVFPQKTSERSERQKGQKEGLYAFGPSHSDISPPIQEDSPQNVRKGPAEFSSDVSDILTVKGEDTDVVFTEEELELVKEAIRFEEQLIGYALDYKIEYRVKEQVSHDRVLQAIKHLAMREEIKSSPLGNGAWRMAK